MKKTMNRLASVSLLSLLLITGFVNKTKAQDVSVSYQSFYDNLSPYGQWVYDPEFGNVWVPNEDGDFRPYGSRGYWAMTEYGNTWISDDPWGWAVYHYGRWTYNPYYGWVWIPGYEWAPAWVNWRYGGGYCGWAPMGPGVNVGISYDAPLSWWVFINPRYMYHSNCISYWRGPAYNNTYYTHTTIINNYYEDNGTHVRYNYGPRAEVIQRTTGQPVQVYRVTQLNRPGAPSVGRNTVSLYRPAVNRASVNNARPANVYEAPKPIGRPQSTTITGTPRQPQFRQDVQHGTVQARNEGGRGTQPIPDRGQQQRNDQIQRQQPNDRIQQQRNDQIQRQQPNDRIQQQRNDQIQRQQPNDRIQQQRNDQIQHQQPNDRIQQQRNDQVQQQRNEQIQQQQANDRMQQQRNEQIQRQQPNDRAQQQQQRNEPAQQHHQEPQRQQPQPQRQQAPQPQQPQRQQAPQPTPPQRQQAPQPRQEEQRGGSRR